MSNDNHTYNDKNSATLNVNYMQVIGTGNLRFRIVAEDVFVGEREVTIASNSIDQAVSSLRADYNNWNEGKNSDFVPEPTELIDTVVSARLLDVDGNEIAYYDLTGNDNEVRSVEAQNDEANEIMNTTNEKDFSMDLAEAKNIASVMLHNSLTQLFGSLISNHEPVEVELDAIYKKCIAALGAARLVGISDDPKVITDYYNKEYGKRN